mgnify:CR=1 FL=1|jgi:Protein of unknown function (DUF2993).
MSWLRKYYLPLLCALLFLSGFALGGGSLAGCGRAVENKAEKAINEMLPQYLGPAKRWSSRVSGKTGAMLRGRLGKVRIEGEDVTLAPGLVVEKLTVDLEDVSVDRGAGQLQDVGKTVFTARLSEAMLNRYVRMYRPTLRDLNITTAADGRLTVRARPELFGYPTLPVEVRGTLRPGGGGAWLDFDPDRAKLSVVPIPVFVAEHIADRLNPAVDLSDLALPIVVEGVQVEQGALTLSGRVPSDALLNAAREAASGGGQRGT